MNTRLTIEQLEHMKTHELADLLANVVLVLRRMPDVPCHELTQQTPHSNFFTPDEEMPTPAPTTSFIESDIKKKNATELKKIAKELHIPNYSKLKKEELISKILERSTNRHSEQYAIQNI